MKFATKCISSAVLYCALIPLAAAQVVIVNASSSVSEMGKDQIAAIFTGKDKSFTPVDNAALRNAFYPAVTGKQGDQIKAYWAKLEFTGRGSAPREESSGGGVNSYVASTPNAIGYVDSAEVGDGVKQVFAVP